MLREAPRAHWAVGRWQGPRARGNTTGYRNTAQPRSPTLAFLKTRSRMHNSDSLLPYTQVTPRRESSLWQNSPTVIHISTHQFGLGVSEAVGTASGLSTSPFNFSSHIPVFLGWPVLDSKCSIYRWASWVCPRMLFGPPSMAAIWAPSMASWESRAAEEAWASASVKDERGE